jgi:hypothetical protein
MDEPMWGNSAEADFEEDTWTFKMCGDDWVVSAGPYAILHNDDYQALVTEIKSLRHDLERAMANHNADINGNDLIEKIAREVERFTLGYSADNEWAKGYKAGRTDAVGIIAEYKK